MFSLVILLLSMSQPLIGSANVAEAGDRECPNTSSGGCGVHQQVNVSADQIYRLNDAAQLDDPSMLNWRLSQIDNIDQSFEFILNLNSESESWYSKNRAEPTLKQVIVLHRHGDRTPIHFETRDPLAKEPFWTFHGLGQLTNRGKLRLHLLGKMYRNRYDSFMGNSVNKNLRISRASGALRCIESAQSFLSSFLALNINGSIDSDRLKWSEEKDTPLGSLWQPASVITAPVGLDGMLAEGSKCKALEREYADVINKSDEVKLINDRFSYVSKVLKEELGMVIDMFYKWVWASSLIEVERSYFEDKLNPKLLEIYESIELAGLMALRPYQSTLKSRRLRGGLLINDMVENMKNFRQLDDQQRPGAKKFVHYAAHDLTIVIILGILDNWDFDTNQPDYASNIAIELHKDDGEWFVKIYYMNVVPSEPSELHLPRCEDGHPKKRCTLDKFSDLMSVYAIGDWQTWFNECQNDFNSLNPYAPSS